MQGRLLRIRPPAVYNTANRLTVFRCYARKGMGESPPGRSQLADIATRPNNIKHNGHAHCVD